MLSLLFVLSTLAFAAEDGDADGFDADVDCDDANTQVNPSAQEVCDGVDNNCDGEIDEASSPDATVWYLDADGDLWGDVRNQLEACSQPLGYVAESGDCNDDEARAYPQNAEVCDGIDNNCAFGIDEASAIDVSKWYQDTDGDGYGDKDLVTESCEAPDTGTWIEAGEPFDCDDADPKLGPCPGEARLCGTSTAGTGASGLAALGLFALRRRRAARVLA